MFVALWLQVGLIIGKGGETIKYLQQQSGARIQVARDADSDSRLSTRQVEIMCSAKQISHVEQLDVLARDIAAVHEPYSSACLYNFTLLPLKNHMKRS